jgi:hypothetical protein
MNGRAQIAGLLAVVGAGIDLRAQDTVFVAIQRVWQAERYDEAFDRLVRYRSAAAYGKNEVVDYMIATSACRTRRADLGRQLFESMLYHYSLDRQSRELVTRERSRCPPAVATRPVSLVTSAAGPVAAGTRGKMYYVLNRRPGDAEVPLANQPARVVREIPESEFRSRLFAPTERAAAIARVSASWGTNGVRVRSFGPFVLASRTHSESEMRTIADGLSAYLDFFVTRFGMSRPESLITVYLATNAATMRSLARALHGIEVSEFSIGYSFRNDQSMVAIIPGMVTGTLAHELFHLVVRRDFGDVPAWIDEGFAALYEVSRLQPDGTVQGLPNWRGEVIRKTGGPESPRLEALLHADWVEFNADDSEAFLQALNHAKARYFALYLQSLGKLHEAYRLMRERDVLKAPGSIREESVITIERLLGKRIADIDRDFIAWFNQLPH